MGSLRGLLLVLFLSVINAKKFYVGYLGKFGGCWDDCAEFSALDLWPQFYAKAGHLMANWMCAYGMQGPGGRYRTACDMTDGWRGANLLRSGFFRIFIDWHQDWSTTEYLFKSQPYNYEVDDLTHYDFPARDNIESKRIPTYLPNAYKGLDRHKKRGFHSLFHPENGDHDFEIFFADTQGTLPGNVGAVLPFLDPTIGHPADVIRCQMGRQQLTCLQNHAPNSRDCWPTCTHYTGKMPRQMDVVVGPYADKYVREVGSIVGFYSVPHIATSMDSKLSDKVDFPTFLRPMPSARVGAEVMVSLCKQLEWTKVGMVYATDEMSQMWANEVASAGARFGVRIQSYGLKMNTVNVDTLKFLAQQDLRIILVVVRKDQLYWIKRTARKADMQNDKYIYVYSPQIPAKKGMVTEDVQFFLNFYQFGVKAYHKWLDTTYQQQLDGWLNPGFDFKTMSAAELRPFFKSQKDYLEWYMDVFHRMAWQAIRWNLKDDKGEPTKKWKHNSEIGDHEGPSMQELHDYETNNNNAGDVFVALVQTRSTKEQAAMYTHRLHNYDRAAYWARADMFLGGIRAAYTVVNGLRIMHHLEEICLQEDTVKLQAVLETYQGHSKDYSNATTFFWTRDQLVSTLIDEYYAYEGVDPFFPDSEGYGGEYTDPVLDKTTLCSRFNGTMGSPYAARQADPHGGNTLRLYHDARSHEKKLTNGIQTSGHRARGQLLYSIMRDTWIDHLSDRDRYLKTGDIYGRYQIMTFRNGAPIVKGWQLENKCIMGQRLYGYPIAGIKSSFNKIERVAPKCGGIAHARIIFGNAVGWKYPLVVGNAISNAQVMRRKAGYSWLMLGGYNKLGRDNCLGCYWGLRRGHGQIPLSQPVVVDLHRRIPPYTRNLVHRITTFAILIAVFLLGFNIKLRNRRYIRMSSPNINSAILIGLIMVMMSVWPMSYDTFDNVMFPTEEERDAKMAPWCSQRVIFLAIGFTLAFESLFAKTYRVHKIFNAKLLGNIKVTDFELFQVVGIFSLIDVALIITWFSVDPLHRYVHRLPIVDNPNNPDERIAEWYESCHSEYIGTWTTIFYCYKGLTLLVGCYLAWQVRNVEIPALNDSKFIGFAIYNTVIVCVFVLPVIPFLSYHPEAWFVYTSTGIIVLSVMVMGFVFFPKVYTVFVNEDELATQSQMTRLNTSKKKTTKWSSKQSSKNSSRFSNKSSAMSQKSSNMSSVQDSKLSEIE